MKHIIIAGAPRSGKTTISRELTYLGYVHYRLDSIKRAVFKIFCPDAKNWPKKENWHKASQVTVQIIEQLIDDNEQESIRKEFFIFDTPHLYPEDVAHLDRDKYIIVFIGYTDVDVDEKVQAILDYDAETCWTHKQTKERLCELVQGNIEFSEEIKAQCEKHGIPYFDVSRHPEINLNKVKTYIKENS